MSGNVNNVHLASSEKTDLKCHHGENFKMEMKREYEQLLLKDKKLDEELKLLLTEDKKGSAGKSYIMEKLHTYNDVKDVTQIVLGSLARLEGVTVTELHEQFGLSYKDNDA